MHAVVDAVAAARHAGRDALSLALLDARNRLLHRLNADPDAAALRRAVGLGRFQEHWIGCHLQRQRGEACDPLAPRLSGIEPRSAVWQLDTGPLPDLETVQAYLAQTLEITLELLAVSAETDDGLHFYRAALWHEDRATEVDIEAGGGAGPPSRTPRPPLQVPATRRWALGSVPGGFVPHNERWAHPVELPDFEIDALPVDWAAYAPFAEDGGYDRREFWSPAGWAWVQAGQRRAPRGVEQFAGGVLLRRGTRAALQRAPATQPAMHLGRFEAEAWCRWAGRRLPTEPEWEAAACTLGGGFVWGDVYEWVAGSARLWPGAGSAVPADASAAGLGPAAGVLRGASFATPRRWHHPKARRFMAVADDHAHCGFRSCAP